METNPITLGVFGVVEGPTMVGAMIGRSSVALKMVASLLIKAYLSLVITAIPAVNPAPGGHKRKIACV